MVVTVRSTPPSGSIERVESDLPSVRRSGGKPFSGGHLYKMLSNPIYAGRLSHSKTYDGQRPLSPTVQTQSAFWQGIRAAASMSRTRR